MRLSVGLVPPPPPPLLVNNQIPGKMQESMHKNDWIRLENKMIMMQIIL